MVYRIMAETLGVQGLCGEDVVSTSHFYALWSKEFKTTVIPKVCHKVVVNMI